MKESRFTEEHITYALRLADSGTPIADVCRQIGVSEATFYTWKKKCADLGVSELRTLRPLEDENMRLRRIVADLTLEKRLDGWAFRILPVIDQWSHESVCLEANFRLTGRCVGQALDRVAALRGWPRAITVDNGTEFTSKALDEGIPPWRQAGLPSTRQAD